MRYNTREQEQDGATDTTVNERGDNAEQQPAGYDTEDKNTGILDGVVEQWKRLIHREAKIEEEKTRQGT